MIIQYANLETLLCWESSWDLRKKERKHRKIKWNKLLIYLFIKEIRQLWRISLKDNMSKKKILVSEAPTNPLVLQEFSVTFFFKLSLNIKAELKLLLLYFLPPISPASLLVTFLYSSLRNISHRELYYSSEHQTTNFRASAFNFFLPSVTMKGVDVS